MSSGNMQDGSGGNTPPQHQHFQIGSSSGLQNQSTISYFPENAGAIRNSEDMNTMDDAQFSASLDALLGGDHLVSRASNNTTPTASNGAQAVGGSCGGGPPGLLAGGTSLSGTLPTHNTTSTTGPPPNSQYLVPHSGTNAPPGAVQAAAPSVSAAASNHLVVPGVASAPRGPGSVSVSHSSHVGHAHVTAATSLPIAQGVTHATAGAPMGASNPKSANQQPHQHQHQHQHPYPHPPPADTGLSLTARLGAFNAAVRQLTPNFGTSGVSAIPWHAAQNPGPQATPSVPPSATPTIPCAGMSATNAVPAFAPSNNNRNSTNNFEKDTKLAAKRGIDSLASVSEDEGERERRRQDRNMREQQRSHRITEQIAHLKEVLSAANIQFKPDKYSTLTKVVEYVKELQDRSASLDSEHRLLINTISKTDEIVKNQYVPAYTSGSDPPVSSDFLTDGSSSPSSEDSSQFVGGIDYKSVFANGGIALALTSIDGRFIDINQEFEKLTGYWRAEMLPVRQHTIQSQLPAPLEANSGKGKQHRNLSLFNILSREDMQIVFVAMSDMLRHTGEVVPTRREDRNNNTPKHVDYWSGKVRLCRTKEFFQLNVTLVRTVLGRPKFFDCALTPVEQPLDQPPDQQQSQPQDQLQPQQQQQQRQQQKRQEESQQSQEMAI